MTEANEMKLTVPLVHLNGTGKANLMQPLDDAWDGLEAVAKCLKQGAPNMRDYYPLQNAMELCQKAQDQHMDRIRRVRNLQDELAALMQAIEAGETTATCNPLT